MKKLLAFVWLFLLPFASAGQENLFATAITVNGIPVSNFEIDQRIRMLETLNVAGDLRRQAESSLIDERIYLSEARKLGINVDQQEVLEGMAEFSARANLSTEAFVAELGQNGVEASTFADFVAAGLLWRKVVTGLFGQVAQTLSTDDFELALEHATDLKSVSVLLSEIIIPLQPGNEEQARTLADRIIESVNSLADFDRAARLTSASVSRERGGDVGWIPISRLPESTQKPVMAAPNDTVVGPVELPSYLYIFFKREMRQVDIVPATKTIDFASLRIDYRDRSRALDIAEQFRQRSKTCLELQFESQAWPEDKFRRQSVRPEELSPGLSQELARLDRHEFALIPATDNREAFDLIMLCKREFFDETEGEQLEQVRLMLRDRRLQVHARNYLTKLRARAIIER